MTSGQWELLPHFLLRSTGLPFEWLERLTFTEAAEAIEAVLACEDEIDALAAEALLALQNCRDRDSIKVRQRCRDRIHRHRPVQMAEEALACLPETLSLLVKRWDFLWEKHTATTASARAVFTRELGKRRAALRDLASDPRFQEAVWLSSPQMFQYGLQGYLERWHPEKRSSDVRHVERQLISYLQRFCAKNDTASFFGPLNYGDFSSDAPQVLPGPGAEHILKREVFLSYWGVLALADKLEADGAIQPYLQPRCSSLCSFDLPGQQVTLPGGRTSRLSLQEGQILKWIDGQRTLQEIASGLQWTDEAVFAGLRRLIQSRLVTLRPEPPVTRVRPLEWLLDWVEQLPPSCPARPRWLGVLGTFKGFQDRFAEASFPERREILARVEEQMSALTGGQARRGGGQLYADRLLLYEECLGGVSPLALGPTFAAELQRQLAPVLDLYAAHACAVHEQLSAYGKALLQDGAPEGVFPFLDLVGTLREKHFEAQPTPVQEALVTMLRAQADRQVVEIDAATLPPLERASFRRHVLLTSPDVMLLARDVEALRAGDFRVVMAECHDTLMVWGWATSFHARRDHVQHDAAAFLARVRGTHTLANVLASKRVKIVPFEYPGPTIEVATISEKPPAERIPIASVTTLLEDGKLYLQAPGWPGFSLYNGELPTLAHSLFAPPRIVPPQITLGKHTPRLIFQNVVLQREQWCLRREELFPGTYQGTSFELLLDTQRAARKLRLPRYLFARVAGERKPVLVDLANYFLLELLAYIVPGEGEVTLTEALPGPNELWLRSSIGTYCAELRLSMGYVSQEGTTR